MIVSGFLEDVRSLPDVDDGDPLLKPDPHPVRVRAVTAAMAPRPTIPRAVWRVMTSPSIWRRI
jgi:hypothetical protein